jgi:hypothetical protein
MGERVIGAKVSERSALASQIWPAGARLPLTQVHPWLAGLWRKHRLIIIMAGLSLLPRLLAALAFRPAVFTPDSFGYLAAGTHLAPGVTRPSGYPILLRVLEPFHSLLLVTTLQHTMGIATAVLVYAVLRRGGLPAWGAVLAACPTLFDTRQVMLESAILPDVCYTLLMMVAVALLLTRRGPTVGRCAIAGFVLAWAAVTRGNGAAAMPAVLVVLLIQRAHWRALAAGTVAFALPVLAYMTVFDLSYGNFALTNSDGLFAWSRTMSFANCAVMKPPADLLPLCPGRQPYHLTGPAPAWSLRPLLNANSPAAYLWASGAWWRHDAHPGINAANNALAMRFALRAISAQPLGYLRTVASGVMLTFLATDRALTVRTMHFTPQPDVAVLRSIQVRHLREYSHTTANTHPVQPYAYFLYLYQEPVYFPGAVFALVIMAGLAGVVRNWRLRGGPGAMPWAMAAAGVVAPVALHEYHYRYAMTVIPVACVAAGLAFARQSAGQHRAVAPTVAGWPGAVPAQTGGDPVPARTGGDPVPMQAVASAVPQAVARPVPAQAVGSPVPAARAVGNDETGAGPAGGSGSAGGRHG